RQSLRVGLMGVWTEAKIYFLAYELRTRYPEFQVAVCSALTASSSRARHFEALDQMERILGVRVVHSVGEFVDYLGGKDLDTPLLGLDERFPEVEGLSHCGDSERVLLRYLFRDCRKVKVRVLDGGFSGNMVLGTQSEDLHGHDQVPHVVKIGDQELMGKERASFERIQHVLGNNAPQVSEFADYKDKGAIKYRYASMGGSFSTTFQQMVQSGAPQVDLDAVMDSVFGEQLSRLYKARTLEQTDLLSHYQFSGRWADSIQRRVELLTGGKAEGEVLHLGEGLTTPNPIPFYRVHLDSLKRGGRCFQAYVHGDLNGANIIVDGHRNVWLIDFFHTRRAHVLMDLIKLENDLLFIFTKLESEEELRAACGLYDHLLEVSDLGAGLPKRKFDDGRLQRTWNTASKLRSFYPALLESDRSPYQWWVGALRYAAHTLGFDECNLWQRKFALYACGHLSKRILATHQNTDRLRVDWLPEDLTLPAKLGLTILPGRADRERDLSDDLDSLEEQSVGAVVCMVPSDELERYGVGELMKRYEARGLPALHAPVVDQKVCSPRELADITGWIDDRLKEKRNVMVHCVGGLGRSGFALAGFLVSRGVDWERAIEVVRESRSPRAVETALQERLIRDYARETAVLREIP
ncbi:MAG: dual specificity protein phosphatase family protein, partial [Candidatus Eremiobacteraeota bacterium]|nr:dual specificity protein phosphatase family protein [Candidatus Eremiobacteraeota bacterium]